MGGEQRQRRRGRSAEDADDQVGMALRALGQAAGDEDPAVELVALAAPGHGGSPLGEQGEVFVGAAGTCCGRGLVSSACVLAAAAAWRRTAGAC